MHLIDLLPTFVAAADGVLDPSWHVDGVNQLAVWTGKAAAADRALFWEWDAEGSRQVAAMHGQFKLVITQGGKPELYDVVNDPAERRDQSAHYPELTRELRDLLHAWLSTATRR
jgi:choline-sulfatase